MHQSFYMLHMKVELTLQVLLPDLSYKQLMDITLGQLIPGEKSMLVFPVGVA